MYICILYYIIYTHIYIHIHTLYYIYILYCYIYILYCYIYMYIIYIYIIRVISWKSHSLLWRTVGSCDTPPWSNVSNGTKPRPGSSGAIPSRHHGFQYDLDDFGVPPWLVGNCYTCWEPPNLDCLVKRTSIWVVESFGNGRDLDSNPPTFIWDLHRQLLETMSLDW